MIFRRVYGDFSKWLYVIIYNNERQKKQTDGRHLQNSVLDWSDWNFVNCFASLSLRRWDWRKRALLSKKLWNLEMDFPTLTQRFVSLLEYTDRIVDVKTDEIDFLVATFRPRHPRFESRNFISGYFERADDFIATAIGSGPRAAKFRFSSDEDEERIIVAAGTTAREEWNWRICEVITTKYRNLRVYDPDRFGLTQRFKTIVQSRMIPSHRISRISIISYNNYTLYLQYKYYVL